VTSWWYITGGSRIQRMSGMNGVLLSQSWGQYTIPRADHIL